MSRICFTVVLAGLLGTSCNGNINGPGTKGASLDWEAPTQNSDGTPLTDLAGYRVYMRTPNNEVTSIEVGNVLMHDVYDLPLGTSTFWVTALDIAGNESEPSTSASKTIQ